MKLLAVLMLTALPLYCSAGADCKIFNGMIEKTLNDQVSPAEFVNYLQPFISDEDTAMGLRLYKQCYLNQNADTLNKIKMMAELMINSPFCASD
ncbi:mammaglobin-A-like [Molossus nigricans]